MKSYYKLINLSFDILQSCTKSEKDRFLLIYDSNTELIKSTLNYQCLILISKLRTTYSSGNIDEYKIFKREVYRNIDELPKLCLLITMTLNSYYTVDLYFKNNIKSWDLTHYRRFESFNWISLTYLIQVNSGNSNVYYSFIEELLSDIDSFELAPIKISIYEMIIGILYSNSLHTEYRNKCLEYQEYRKNYESFINIKLFVEELALKYRSQIYLNDDYIQLLKLYYDKSIDYCENSQIDTATLYYFLILKIDYQFYFDFDNLFESLSQFEFFLKTNKISVGKARYFSGINNLVLNYFLIGKIEYAQRLILKYITDNDLLPRQRINLFIILFNHFLINKEFENYNKYFNLILTYDREKILLFENLQFCLISAAYYHCLNNYKVSHSYLQKTTKLLSDKSGYGLGIRILEIMNFIKWSKFEQIDSALINLKNHITFLKKGGKIKPRYIFIYKILLKLHTSGYDYKDTFRLYKNKLRLMNGEDRFYAFEFRSPELVRFDTWFFDQAGFLPDWPLNDFRLY